MFFLLQKLWSMRFQFAKYFIIGIGSVILDICSLYFLKEYLDFTPTMAVVINQIFILNYIFFLNKYWAFKAQGVTHQQMIRFGMVAGMNYTISVGWMWFFNGRLGWNYLLMRLINIILMVSWNFLLYKFFVYRVKTDSVNNLTA